MENDKLDKAAEYASPIVSSNDGRTFKSGFIKGAEWLMGQPLSERLSEKERENLKELYSNLLNTITESKMKHERCLPLINFQDEFISFFGEELFVKLFSKE